MKNESPLDGIIAGLTAEHGGNVSDRGIVAISGSVADESAGFAARNAADLKTSQITFTHQTSRINGSAMISKIAKCD
jgi:hypothetical protein